MTRHRDDKDSDVADYLLIKEVENWHGLLKKETLHNNDYQTINEYVNGVFDWIWFYKTERISLSERQHNINENIC